ncbi:MAG: sulfatase [Cyclobacteriaceae bacterium]|nr:sulfatase [Cyclobacteriaceae bacterium SS2]
MKINPTSFVAILLVIAACSTKPEQQTPPNIILLISDDQSWTDYSFMGHETIQTPRIDQLANEGLTFTYGYATAPLCSPSLASMITGLFPHQHGILGNDPVFETEGPRYREQWLQQRKELYNEYEKQFEELATIPDLLKQKGYVSLQTGKWWLGHYGTGGFDDGMTHGDPTRGGRHGDEGLKIGREGLQTVYDFIDDAQTNEKPFFVWYAPFLPHAPHTPPDSILAKYTDKTPSEAVARYWAMCEWFDITCGQLMDDIERRGLSENTLFVYVTDNGWIQDPDKVNRYAPRSKREPYEMGIRTPIMFRWQGKIVPEMNTTDAVSAIDIATTILGINEIEPTADMQGINVLDKQVLEGRDMIFAENFAHDFSSLDSSVYHRMAIDLPYKLILPDPMNQPEDQVELFNIVDDPHEENNLVATDPGKVKELTARIEQWWVE